MITTVVFLASPPCFSLVAFSSSRNRLFRRAWKSFVALKCHCRRPALRRYINVLAPVNWLISLSSLQAFVDTLSRLASRTDSTSIHEMFNIEILAHDITACSYVFTKEAFAVACSPAISKAGFAHFSVLRSLLSVFKWYAYFDTFGFTRVAAVGMKIAVFLISGRTLASPKASSGA